METAQYETWQRTLIDLLIKDNWELSQIIPPPPVVNWYNKGLTPEEAYHQIKTHHKHPVKKKYKPRGAAYPRLLKGTHRTQ